MTGNPQPPLPLLLRALHGCRHLTRPSTFPLALRRSLVAEHELLEARHREFHTLGEALAREKAAVALLKRELAEQKARGDRHFDRAERQLAEHNAALGLRARAAEPSDDLPPRPEPTVRMTANRRRLRDVSQPAAAFVHPARAGGTSPAPAPVGDHPPRPA